MGGWRRTPPVAAAEADETLVVTHEGTRIPIACREAFALREREGRVHVGAAFWDIAENSTARRIRPTIAVTPSGAFAGVGGAF